MPRSKYRKKEINFEINEHTLDTLIEVASSTEAKEIDIAFPAADGKGVTFGSGLSYREYEGEGLPEGSKFEFPGFSHNFSITLDFRFDCDPEGNATLYAARKNSNRYFRFPFSGLTSGDAAEASFDFRQELDRGLIFPYLYWLAWACYRKQDPNRKARNEYFERIMDGLEIRLKRLLKWRNFKVSNLEYVGDIEIITEIPSEAQRPKGTKGIKRKDSAKEKEEKAKRKPKILDALRKAKNKESKSEIARLIGVSRQTLRKWLADLEKADSKDGFFSLIRKVESE